MKYAEGSKDEALRAMQAAADIEDEHMLLNLVRMRYSETPVFLQISSISTTYGVSTPRPLRRWRPVS